MVDEGTGASGGKHMVSFPLSLARDKGRDQCPETPLREAMEKLEDFSSTHTLRLEGSRWLSRRGTQRESPPPPLPSPQFNKNHLINVGLSLGQ